jgi:hypothetical protein
LQREYENQAKKSRKITTEKISKHVADFSYCVYRVCITYSGIRTVSIAWIIPFDAVMSVMTILLVFTVGDQSFASIITIDHSAVVAARVPVSANTSDAVYTHGTT